MKVLAFLLLFIGLAQAETGIASWYGKQWHGKKTANGERYDMNSGTCAHKKHSFHTMLKVIAPNDKFTICRVNNRGPFIRGRIIDLSAKGARDLDIITKGTIKVNIEVLGRCVPTGSALIKC